MGSLGQTAKLLASLSLDPSKFKAGAQSAMGSLGKLEGRFGKLGSIAQRGLSNAVTNIKRLALVGVGVIAANVTAGIKSLASIEKAQTATKQALESTKGVAGQTFDEITARSQKWSEAIGIDEESVQHLQNVLLTFTKIGSTQFDQATEAALNMSTVLGQDVQQSAVQLGKALNDPVKGMTALRRVGVTFSDEQIKNVKKLVAAGKIEAAQQLILNELQTEFGGQAEKSGQTAEGQFKRFGQAVQEAQRSLATAFLPVLLEVGKELRTWLQDPKVQQGLKDFGKEAAGAFKSLLNAARNIPWGTIVDAAKAIGTGAKALLDAFTSLPPWVQTAVITGWGLNKLTGGALGGIVGELGKGLIKGVLGMNAGVVNINAGVVNGGGGGGPGGLVKGAGAAAGGGIITTVLAAASVTALAGAVAIGLYDVIPSIFRKPPEHAGGEQAPLQHTPSVVGPNAAMIRLFTPIIRGKYGTPARPVVSPSKKSREVRTVQHATSERTDQYLSELNKKQDKLGDKINRATKHGNERRAAKLQGKMHDVKTEIGKFKDTQKRVVALTGRQSVTAFDRGSSSMVRTTSAGDNDIVRAINASKTDVTVKITAVDVQKTSVTRNRAGPSTGSSGGGSLAKNRGAHQALSPG